MQQELQLEQWFYRTFANLERDKDQLKGGLENSKGQLLEIYARYLFRKSKAMIRWSGIPIPDEDFPPLPPGFAFPILEEKGIFRDIFQELEEWMEANIQEGARREFELAEEARYCTVVERELKAASGCVQRFSARMPQSDKEWEEFRRCISDVGRLASEAEALGCH